MAPQRFLIIADGDFYPMTSKTANAVIRFMPERVIGVLDHVAAGQTVQDVLGFGGDIPVVGTIEEGLRLAPDAIMIGIAPAGGQLPPAWRTWLLAGLEAGCDLWSGLHTFLGADPVLAVRAQELGREIRDVRRAPADLPVAAGKARLVEPMVILTVGTDCNVGKMTAQLKLTAVLNAQGVRTRFVATGQTGIFIEGWGIAGDAVVADCIAGAAEHLVLEGAKGADIVMVEGQGSINHPGYSGVTLGLLHGSCPNALILCHQASRTTLSEYRGKDWLPVPPLEDYLGWYQAIGSAVWPTRVVGICLNTFDLSEDAARAACARATAETGLPCTDPVRFPEDATLTDAILAARQRYLATGAC